MEIKRNSIFNLWDTNGRRKDVINALEIYLRILKEEKENFPGEIWSSYPESTSQFRFYERAISESPEIFKKHDGYDRFMERIAGKREAFIRKSRLGEVTEMDFDDDMQKWLDESIEQRARHYTSNLVKIGFADKQRNITAAGYAFLRTGFIETERDILENILPVNITNLVLIRQLLKLKVFSKAEESASVRTFYSPFKMALYLLLKYDNIDKDMFRKIVQGCSPNMRIKDADYIIENFLNGNDSDLRPAGEIPLEFREDGCISEEIFGRFIKNRKSARNSAAIYYGFYKALYNFKKNSSEANYRQLVAALSEDAQMIQKAFGMGKSIFDIGRSGPYDLNTFKARNRNNIFLTAENFNITFYEQYEQSKYIDTLMEYSDTTIRLFGASGLFKFQKSLPELAYRDVLEYIFDTDELKKSIFGTFTENEYEKYEGEGNGEFYKDISICEIMNYSIDTASEILKKIENKLGTSEDGLREELRHKIGEDFKRYIDEKYDRNTIIYILRMFSDRSNDEKIKEIVSSSASVPTIYEYITAIAWYYLSGKTYDVYDTLNLTMNADFEPVMHASGGTGDIIIEELNRTVMLEVTLMNKAAQKRGEWEPVLRHSINLKAKCDPKETITFFIADELDYNTVNIWRAVAAVPLESSGTRKKTQNVIIMPITNKELGNFLENSVNVDMLIDKVKNSYMSLSKEFDDSWRENILAGLNNI